MSQYLRNVIIFTATLIFGNAALVVIALLLLRERRKVREILEAVQLVGYESK